jgi:hypothetical protein
MVLAFLRAEFYSPRFGPHARALLGNNAALVEDPHLDDADENAIRRHALAKYRGYGENAWIFAGIPADTTWLQATYTVEEVGAFLYANYPDWVNLSEGSRLVKDGAANVLRVPMPDNSNHNIVSVQRRLANGERFPELILVAEREDSVPMIVEGHTRATAYVRGLPGDEEVQALLGVSAGMGAWVWA